MLWGDICTAFQDINLALSQEYTVPDSPKALTTKCLFRRAKLHYKFARYDEARTAFESFERVREEIGQEIGVRERDLLSQIEKAISEPGDSEAENRAQRLRAVSVRALFLANWYTRLHINLIFIWSRGIII